MPFKNDKQRKAAFARLNSNRTQQAMNSDLSKRAANTLPYSADNVKAWRDSRGRIDIEGIDTPMLKIKKIDVIDETTPTEYRYAMYNRPAWAGMSLSQPHEYDTNLTDPSIQKNREYHNRDAHSIIITKTPLTPDEIKNLELVDIAADNKQRVQKDKLISHIKQLDDVSDSGKNALISTVKTGTYIKTIDDVDKYADMYMSQGKRREEFKKELQKNGIKDKVEQDVPPTTDFDVDKTLINEDLALHAHSGTSFDPELRAKSEVDTFEFEMKNTYKTLSEGAKTPEQKAILNEEMHKFQENYAKKQNELLSSRSKIISPMITGPANFPTRRNQKANDAYDNKYRKFLEWESKARGSISRKIERHEKQRIMDEAGGEVALMKQKLKKAEDHQQEMKDANKIIRKKIPESERVGQLEQIGVKAGMGKLLIETGGYETYQMTNNNANIKRMKERVKEMEVKEATPTSTIKFIGGEIIDNNQEDRVQIFFDEKPDTDMRTKLKDSGWRWTPSNGVWQRKRTNAARYSAQQITGE